MWKDYSFTYLNSSFFRQSPEWIKDFIDELMRQAHRRYAYPVFVFGDSVYELEEAREAMIEYGEMDMEENQLDVDDYIARQLACAYERPKDDDEEAVHRRARMNGRE